MKKKPDTKRTVLLGMLAAVSYLTVMLIRIPVVSFLKYEPKDVIIVIAGFLYGPAACAVISGIVSLVEMLTLSQTGPIGCLMNFLSTCAYACTAAWIYRRYHTRRGAVLSLLGGTLLMVGIMLLWNWLITPLYMTGTSRADVAAMLLPVFLPFNLFKGGLNSALTLLLYKPVVQALRRGGLVAPSQSQPSGRYGTVLFALLLALTCILILLAMQGIF